MRFWAFLGILAAGGLGYYAIKKKMAKIADNILFSGYNLTRLDPFDGAVIKIDITIKLLNNNAFALPILFDKVGIFYNQKQYATIPMPYKSLEAGENFWKIKFGFEKDNAMHLFLDYAKKGKEVLKGFKILIPLKIWFIKYDFWLDL